MSDNKPNATVVPLSLDNFIIGLKKPNIATEDFEEWVYSLFGATVPGAGNVSTEDCTGEGCGNKCKKECQDPGPVQSSFRFYLTK